MHLLLSAERDASLRRDLVVEVVGAALLTTGVVGSGIMATTLSPHNLGLDLLINAAATAGVLYAVITALGSVAPCHMNPAVTAVLWMRGHVDGRRAALFVPAQVIGCCLGAVVANVMFARSAVTLSTHHRATASHLLAEFVATLGLVTVITVLVERGHAEKVAGSVAAFIGGAYFFTSSTSFANPAIVIGRMLSNTFAGIAPESAPAFIGMEAAGALGAALLLTQLVSRPKVAPR